MGDVDWGEGWTTRIGSSSALTQVQAGAGADHHRHRSELDRDLGGIMAVILGVEVSKTIDFVNQSEGAAEAVTTTKGTLPPIPTPTSRATTATRTTPHRSSSISSSSHTVHHLPLLLQPLHVLIPGRLPQPLLFSPLGYHLECVEASLRLILSWGIGKNLSCLLYTSDAADE